MGKGGESMDEKKKAPVVNDESEINEEALAEFLDGSEEGEDENEQ